MLRPMHAIRLSLTLQVLKVRRLVVDSGYFVYRSTRTLAVMPWASIRSMLH